MLQQIAAIAPAMRNFSFLILQIETRAQLCKNKSGADAEQSRWKKESLIDRIRKVPPISA